MFGFGSKSTSDYDVNTWGPAEMLANEKELKNSSDPSRTVDLNRFLKG